MSCSLAFSPRITAGRRATPRPSAGSTRASTCWVCPALPDVGRSTSVDVRLSVPLERIDVRGSWDATLSLQLVGRRHIGDACGKCQYLRELAGRYFFAVVSEVVNG